MSVKRYVLVVLILIVCFNQFSYAQSKKIETLKLELKHAKDDVVRADINCQLAEQLYLYDFEQGYSYAETSLKISEKIKYLKGSVQALTSIGTYYYYKGEIAESYRFYWQALNKMSGSSLNDYPFKTYIRLSILFRTQASFDSAEYYLNKASFLLPKNDQSSFHASYYASLGILANNKSQNKEAIALLNKSLRIRMILKDTNRMADTWRNMGVAYTDLSKYDSAEYCYQRAELFLNKLDNPEIRMTLNINKGETYFARGEIGSAIEHYNLALDMLKVNTYRKYYSHLLYKIGELYSNQNDYESGYDYLFKAVREFELINSRQDLAKTYSQIGWNYNFQKNYFKALDNGRKSLRLAHQLGDSAGVAQNQNLIGYSLLKSGKFSEALHYLDSAREIRNRLGLRWGETFTIYNQALVYIELGNFEKAFDLLFMALTIAEEINNNSAYVYISNELGSLFTKTKEFSQAEYHLNNAQFMAKKVPLTSQLLTNYKNYFSLFDLKKDKDQSLVYYRKYTSLKDSIDNQISSAEMANADALFLLQNKTNELQLKIDENLIQKEKINEQNELIKIQKRMLMTIGISLAILIIFLFVIIRLLVSRSRAKEILSKQNFAIKEQKEEIQAQSEELVEANEHLGALNEVLSEKNVEIEAQASMLSKANNSLERQVSDRTLELSKAYNELETFFYKTSHDFRRPLTTYLGLVEVAKNSVVDAQALDLFEKIRITTIGLDKMLVKLQSISNIYYEDTPNPFELSELIADCINAEKALIDKKGIQISLTNIHLIVNGNMFLYKIVLENLIENAVEFSNLINPFIQINCISNSKEIVLTVEDNGMGIIKSIESRIFDMYFRGNEASQGNGLGLYVTKRAVDKLKGNITFKSEVGKGTLFKVTIPIL